MTITMVERRSAWSAGSWARFSMPLLLAAIVLPLIGRIYLAVFEAPTGAGVAPWPAVAAIVLEALPPLILAWSMFGLIGALAEYEQGHFASLRASAGLKRAGAGATIALVLQVLVPVGLAALKGQPLWPALNPNVFDLAVMIFASSMLAVGSVLEAAARELQSETDQII
jgi:hypothetical protein